MRPMAKRGPCGKFRIISEDMHSQLLADYMLTDITIKELAEKWSVNQQSLRIFLSGYMFGNKPKKPGLRGRTPKNVSWKVTT